MDLITRHPYATAAVLGVVAVAIALLVPVGGSGDGDDDRPAARPSVHGPSLGPERVSRSDDEKDEDAGSDAEGGAVSMGPATLPEPAGLAGEGRSIDTRYLSVTMTVTSSQPIGVVGYQVPTSPDHPSGIARNVGRSWSLTAKAYGKPDYAQLFLQAGPTGAPVTCTISVDGKVTERRTSSGPYAQMLCQG